MENNEYQIIEPKKGRLKIIMLALAFFAVLGLSIGIYYFIKINRTASSDSNPVTFVVLKGSAIKQIAEELDEQNIINNPWVFYSYVVLNGASGKIQAGDYVLNRNMSITEIVDILTKGKVISSDRKITIVEGLTNKQIGEYLEKRNIGSNEDFTKALAQKNYNFKYNQEALSFNYQGFLFPDTYSVGKSPSLAKLVENMLKNFEGKVTDQMIADLKAKNISLSNAIILASIIEKEVGRNTERLSAGDIQLLQEERQMVAAVFYNRLKSGMPLESDATVNYVTGKADRSVLISDTKVKSAYNTYANKGLPPGPISNPGLGSIMAAIYPSNSDYLFFLNTPEGQAVFGKTLAEHNRNREKYLR